MYRDLAVLLTLDEDRYDVVIVVNNNKVRTLADCDGTDDVVFTDLTSGIDLGKNLLEGMGITDFKAHFQKYVNDYNKTAVPSKKIGLLKVREEEFPKNTLRKILRRKMDMTID